MASTHPASTSRLWILALLCACGWVAWIDWNRSQRVDHVSGLGGVRPAADADSRTGYAGGVRRLIVPDQNRESYQWIAQTQQMQERGEWRVRQVEYDNAPPGRRVQLASPFRWWLWLLAKVDQMWSGRPFGAAVERAAIVAGPILHVLLLVLTTRWVAQRFGGAAAAVMALGLATLFPFSAEFLPGQPDDGALEAAAALWSGLWLMAGLRSLPVPDGSAESAASMRRARRSFFLAGAAGGFGLWLNVASQVPVIVGVLVGGTALAWLGRRSRGGGATLAPWRAWAAGGAAVSTVGFLLEHAPGDLLHLRLDANHPVYALAWLAAGELLARFGPWLLAAPRPLARGHRLAVALASGLPLALAAAVVVWHGRGILRATISSALTNPAIGTVADNLVQWLLRDGLTRLVLAAALPLLVLVAGLGLALRRATAEQDRATLTLALGPALVSLALACTRLHGWSLLNGALLALSVAVTAAALTRAAAWRSWAVTGLSALVLLPGAFLQAAAARAPKGNTISTAEFEALLERDLAHWLAQRAPERGAVVLAPPNLTAALFYYGGLRGLGSPYWENMDGFAVAVRIAATSSADEAQALCERRKVRYIVLPSWDDYLQEYARLGSEQPEKSLVAMLQQWLPPRWLRPVAYPAPNIPGFAGRSVVFEVVEPVDNATALSWLAEYFVETQQLDHAAAVGQTLQTHFPDELAALIAQAQVHHARGEGLAFRGALEAIVRQVRQGEDARLSWDRAVSLAVVLAAGKQFDLAREQVQRCVADINEARVRSLSTVSLYRLQALLKLFAIEIAEPRIQMLARALLPPEMREQLEQPKR